MAVINKALPYEDKKMTNHKILKDLGRLTTALYLSVSAVALPTVAVADHGYDCDTDSIAARDRLASHDTLGQKLKRKLSGG